MGQIRIGHYRVANPNTCFSESYDTNERETQVYLQKLLGDSTVDRVWVRRGASEVVYLKGDASRPASGRVRARTKN